VNEGDTFFDVRCTILSILKLKHNLMNMGKEGLKERAAHFCWMLSGLLASVDVMEFQITEAYSSLNTTRVK
jgi:hypothetical protein